MCRDDPVYCYFVDYGTTEERTHNSVNEVTAIDTNNDADFLYDKNGNLTKWTDDPEGTPVVKEFLWDDLNRLTKIIVDSDDEAIFIYDVNNQRVRKEYDSDDDGDIDGNDETIEFVWADAHVIEEYVDGSLDRNYVHGNQFIDELVLFEDSSGDYHYYLQDFRYTVYALVDDTGTIEERYRFDPYGKRTVVTDDGSIDEHYGFTGRYHDDTDDTDLIYFRERWISPEMGRFVSRHSFDFMDGMNVYGMYFVNHQISLGIYLPKDFPYPLVWAGEYNEAYPSKKPKKGIKPKPEKKIKPGKLTPEQVEVCKQAYKERVCGGEGCVVCKDGVKYPCIAIHPFKVIERSNCPPKFRNTVAWSYIKCVVMHEQTHLPDCYCKPAPKGKLDQATYKRAGLEGPSEARARAVEKRCYDEEKSKACSKLCGEEKKQCEECFETMWNVHAGW